MERPLANGDRRALEGHSSRVCGTVVLADGARALSWSEDTLRLWNLESGAVLRKLEGHSRVLGAEVLADGARALSWSWDNSLRLWDLESGTVLRTLEGHSRRIVGAAVLADGARALSWSEDGTLRLWDLNSLHEFARFVGDDPLTCCGISQDGWLAVAGDSRGRVLCFDLQRTRGGGQLTYRCER